MQFDSNGLPKDSGASDYADSARLAGLLATFGHPAMDREKILQYVKEEGGELVGMRYPYVDPTGNLSSNNPKNFTRDQLMCLAAGLSALDCPVACAKLLGAAERRGNRAQNVEKDVPGSTKLFPDGADLLTPSNVNHLEMCAGFKGTLLGKAWLVMDICWNAWFSPMSEPNQLMCQAKIAGPMYVKLMRRLNKKLDAAIDEYWSGWRGEPELAQFLKEKFN